MYLRSILKIVKLSDSKRKYPHELSGGEQQRTALARSIIAQPDLLLLDEPFSSLDLNLKEEVRDDTLHLLQRFNISAIVVTHDPFEAMFMSNIIYIMDKEGNIVQSGEPKDLYTKPVNPYVAEFFGEINRITGVVESGSISTPLGEFIAEGLEEGREVQILIRPELLQLKRNSDASGLKGRVITSKMLGQTSLIHLNVCKQGRDLHLHSRMPGRFLPEGEAEVYIEFDPIHAFVFPLGSKC